MTHKPSPGRKRMMDAVDRYYSERGLRENTEAVRELASLIARKADSAPSNVKKGAKQPTPRQRRIHALCATGVKGIDYCRALDAARIRPPASWTKPGRICPSKYEAAYQRGWAKVIQQEKWKASAIVRKSTLATLA